jgi:hypothetical protein
MNVNLNLDMHLEDVLGELHHARRMDDLGRLVLVTYWDVRRWARSVRREALASRAGELICAQPLPSRAACLEIVDDVIRELERIQAEAAHGLQDLHDGSGAGFEAARRMREEPCALLP